MPAAAFTVDPAVACADPAAVHVAPGDPVRNLVADAAEGATVCFADGRYRLRQPIRPRTGQILTAAPDAHPVLDGSVHLRGFTRTHDGWMIGGQRQQGERTGFCDAPRRSPDAEACTYPDDVFRDGEPLRRVLDRDRIAPDAYWFDYRRDRILVGADPRGRTIEAAVAPAGIRSRDDGAAVTVHGLELERFATPAQRGALQTWAPGWRVEDVTARRNHGAGITSEGDIVITGSRAVRNGQLGIGGSGDRHVVVGTELAHNNVLAFDTGWEAGGGKWAVADGVVLEGNLVHDNLGPGLWTDIDCTEVEMRGNLVERNSGMGMFHEISGSAVIEQNVVVGNGHGYPVWLWGSGILLAGSHDVVVRDNVLSGNASGIGLVQQDRGRAGDLPDGERRRLRDVDIVGNTVWMHGGLSGAVQDSGNEWVFDEPTIRWSGNTWHGADAGGFAWNDDELTPAQWRALGHDVEGVFD